ncbi:Ig-like domain-containing protein [Thiothrix fructosivorans]|uniref:Tandem-95 repeat protein n=1 Tax=Thiothrix fructosivorans TaxID=111770 RepID=A0A8B0SEC4_9GAMM|nr:Ig-like domain-containing protein [Thiothrix fructosivorans]MBO0614255.1 tandem-95 repeat protein [Thiothrix fructosivorans]QTX09105.1 tandem-95 repeat protein [Thiothrix fructosivorans]
MMNNKKIFPPQWAILPLLFCSAAVLAGDGGLDAPYGQLPPPPAHSLTLEDEAAINAVPAPMPMAATPDTMRQAQDLGQQADGFLEDSSETSSVNTGYVGGNTRIGIGVDTELKGKADVSHVIRDTGSSATIGQGYVGFNPSADKALGEESLTGAGAKLSHHWVSGDPNTATSVNKVFGAYDQNELKDKKATLGYGQESEAMFWSGHISKGLSEARIVAPGINAKAYDLGVGGRVGTYLPDQQMRVQGGLDYEWGTDFADSETRPAQTTVTGGVEKFFPDTPHSVGAEVEVYKKAGGAVVAGSSEDAEARGGVSYRYDIGSEAGVWQPEQRYRRIRTEIPGEQIKQPPKIERKLVKNTMELESDTFFKLDRAELTPEAKERMKAVIGQIRASGHDGNIRITGNTCDKGSDAHNLKLSERRANAVRDFMVKNGFNGNELLAQGLGESQPKYPNTDAEGHKNRRVDIEYVTYQNEYKDEVIEQGGTSTTDPKVVWRKELIPEPPLWVRQALRNVADHKQSVDTYTTSAGTGGSVSPNAPVAVNDTATTTSGTPVSIAVLANDTDPNGDVLSIVSFNQGANGSVTQVGNALVYTSVAGFTGTDTFTYVIKDPAGNQSTATVTVNVGATDPNAPLARNDTATTTSGTPVNIAVLTNDIDPNGDVLSIVSFNQGSDGAVTQVANNLVYTSVAGFTGTDTFTYVIKDPAGNRSTATVTVTVASTGTSANPPIAAPDQVETLQDTAVTIKVLDNDSDLDGNTLTLTGVGADAAHGTAIRSGNNVIYTPNAGFAGEDQFTYTVADGTGNSTVGHVFVKINTPGGNLKATNDLYTVNMNSSANSFDVMSNDEFPTTGATVTIVSNASNGSASVSGGKVLYTPKTGYSGTDKLTYRLTDSRGYTADAVIDITISNTTTPSNLAPKDDYLLIDLNDTVTRKLSVLSNDTGDGMEIIAVSTPRYGTAAISADGQSINFTLRSGYCADHSFTYIVKDKYGNQKQATVVIDVVPANLTDPNAPPA